MSATNPPIRVLVDPYALVCPDFSLPEWKDSREDAVKARQITEAEAIALLAKRWTDGNDRSKADWDAQVAADKVAADAAEDQRLAAEKLAEAAADRARKDALQAIIDKKPQLGVFDSNTKAPDFVHSLVHPTALKLVQARRYVSLIQQLTWTPPPPMTLSRTVLRVLLGQEPVSRKLPGESAMDWAYFPEAYNGYIRAIIADNWPADHVHALNDLFFKIGGHDFAQRGVLGKRALLAYCESMRRLWHNDFEAGRVSFNIGDINITSLEAKYNEIIANESTAAIQTSRDSNAESTGVASET
ncbi:hypothetical protein BDZ89DRAFT_1112038 [Hymenopellis radicata]|nr:hypothetical protein BDZ89DRAFT_1112038 [Hymenopellis radicata]